MIYIKFKQFLTTYIFKYLLMASIIVLIEIISFGFFNSILRINYLLATALSMIIGILLNWYISSNYVFSGSRHKLHLEVFLVFTASIIGLLIQLFVVKISVEQFNFYPIIGKLFAILITFFWNFWFRKRYIFH